MPPPMPHSSKRMTAQPSRPVARYRPGKAIHEESSDEEGSEEERQQQPVPQKKTQRRPPTQPQQQQPRPQEEDEDGEEGFVTDPEDEDEGSVPISAAKLSLASTKPIAAPAASRLRPNPAQASSEEESEEEEESSEASSEEEEESSEDEPQRKFQRPTFIKKSHRDNQPTTTGTIPTSVPTPATASNTKTEDTDRARRIAETDTLIANRINLDNAARAAGRRAWDDDDDLTPEQMVDDTDGLDPAAEHAAWRLRELKRLKRDREALVQREKDIEELERRRNLTAEEREAEDREFLEKQKADREDSRTQSAYLSRYHHKGAFFQDSEIADQLKRRDLMGAKFVDEVSDKSTLPEFMRIRDMNKLGKKGRTRYTDLKTEDTGRYGDEVRRWKGAMGAGSYGGRGEGKREGMDMRGVDERFLPDDHRNGPRASGANMAPVGSRTEKERERTQRSRSPRRDDGRGDSYRPRRRPYSRSRSRSKTPPRRKRSPSPYRDRDRSRDVDKRRRVDAV